MKSDIEIASSVRMQPINKVAKSLKIKDKYLEPYGKYKAKIDLKINNELKDKENGKLILVTAINPTKYGEGKTTTTIGLMEAFKEMNVDAILTLREPSLGPVFGIKGGACGGGYAQVVPMEDINLHFTGDMHALTTTNNLICACIDNELYWGNRLNLDPNKITFKRCLDLNDRSLREVSIGDDKKNGVKRVDNFNITVASEVMAAFCLSENLDDFASLIDEAIVGYTFDNKVVKVKDLNITGSLKVLMKDAIKPNLVQTLNHAPVLIHGGPFANIAHGCNSLIATKMGLKLASYCISEAGFGADLGMEKFFDIKCNKGGLTPNVVVLVATIRALKHHGGSNDANKEDLISLEKGFANLDKHIENIKLYGVPFVVAINKFSTDTKKELDLLLNYCHKKGYPVEINSSYLHGAKGAYDLASTVLKLADEKPNFKLLYNLEDTIENKIEIIAKKIYGASDIEYEDKAKESLKLIRDNNLDKDLLICMAKTPMSLSDDEKLVGRPENFTLHIKDIKLANSVKFLIVLTGNILTMPGLSKDCAAKKITMDSNGKIEGLF
jgi:formate--tetrahydrofolate ligase